MKIDQFMIIPKQDQTFAECMEVLREYRAPQTIKYLISDYVFWELRMACTIQCKLEGLL